MQADTTVIIRNAKIDMFKGSMRLAVDKWGRIEVTEPACFTVKEENNLSLVEYELVNVVEKWKWGHFRKLLGDVAPDLVGHISIWKWKRFYDKFDFVVGNSWICSSEILVLVACDLFLFFLICYVVSGHYIIFCFHVARSEICF